ncbi:MAG: virulence protein [Oscillospiraceae bacterium]|nr:virulence protein [Ruminococcus sp.]MCD8345001.1 virulence protein [Oscillospiraceae bacterium]
MEVKYNVTGTRRKELVNTISELTGAKPEYKGAPTFSYEIDFFTVTKDGTLTFSDRSDSDIVENVLEGISDAGFEFEEPEESEETGLTVSVPLDSVSAGNLTNLLESKGELIKKALGIDNLPIEIEEDKISFPWFKELPDPDSIQAYTHFIAAICKMSKEQKRINKTEKETDNEKYAFRCFLLRLGFIGEEYKTERKILLKNLTGSSAFRNGGAKHEVSE